MCLYETKINNIKYLPNKKNKGNAPTCTDKKLATISIGCGWCEECRKKIANDWRIRLYEEIKSNKGYYFVTLSFSPAAINQIETEMYTKKWRGLETEEGEIKCDVNVLAAYAVRMWSERWRKHNKKAPRHWLITELGHKNSERIHLHGLIQGSPEMIEKTWQYGNVYCGTFVNERTINYIIKYVTKLDEQHKGYKQKIFVSKGIGKEYIEKYRKWHEFKGIQTRTEYITYNGIKLALPRYYKEKIWNEEQREAIWLQEMEKNKIYLGGEEIDKTIDLNEWNNKLNAVRDNNKRAGYGDNTSGNKTFLITEIMKLRKDEIIDYNKDKLVKETQRREIESKEETTESKEVSKANGIDKIHYGQYIGNTTESMRNYNQLLNEAKSLGVGVRVMRLIKEGIINVDNFVNK